MNRQVGATTVMAALLLTVGAVLLSTQWPIPQAQAMALASPLYLAAEIGLYLVFLVILDRGLTAAGYAAGAFGALGIRMIIGFSAAGLDYLRVGGYFDTHLYPAIFSLARVAIGVTTAAGILVLLRDLLPQRRRPAPAAPARAAAKPAAAEPAPKLAFEAPVSDAGPPERPSEIILLDPQPGPSPAPADEPVSDQVLEGEIGLPLSVLLRDAPEGVRPAQGHEEAVARIPMSLIGTQLAEACVSLPAALLAECAPQGALDISGLDDSQTDVPLPLEAVVEALPQGALDRGAPRPPAWQCELDETEEALFTAA